MRDHLVLRTINMLEVVEHLTALGLTFKEEQHGASPVYYSCAVGDVLLEVYPGGPNGRVTFYPRD